MLRRIRIQRDSDGFTLVELLVAMVLLSIIVGLTTKLVITALDQQSNTAQESEAQNRNNTGMELMTRLLRQAVFPVNGDNTNSSIITQATASSLQFTSRFSSTQNANQTAIDTPVQQYVFKTNGTNLQWGSAAQNACTAPAVCTYGSVATFRTVVYGVRNASGTSVCPQNTGDGAVFHYFYFDPSGALTPWAGTQVQSSLKQISVVQIDLWTQTQTGPQRPACVQLTDYVQLRNWQ